MSLPSAARKSLVDLQSLFEAKNASFSSLTHVLVEIPYPATRSSCAPPNEEDKLGLLKPDAFTRGQFVAAGNLNRSDTEEVLAHIARQQELPEEEAAAVIRKGIEAGIESAKAYIESPFGRASTEAEIAVNFVFARSNRLITYFKRPANAIQVFIDDDPQHGREALEALCRLAETSVEILVAHRLYEPTDPPPAHSEPNWFEAKKNHYAGQWMLFVHEYAKKHPDALPRSVSAPFLENHRLKQGGMAKTLTPGVFKASSQIIERILSEMAEHQRQALPPPEVEQVCDRTPSVDQLLDVYRTLWRFMQRFRYESWIVKQENELRPFFTHLADVLHPVRFQIEDVKGWPHRVKRALPLILEAFDETARLWGWERLVAPEPERSAFIAERNDWFRENVKRPRCEAALSWQAGCRGMECPPEIDNIADECLEFEPTMTPEEGKARFREAEKRWCNSPRLGICYPRLGDTEREKLDTAWGMLRAVLLPIRPNEATYPGWQHTDARVPEAVSGQTEDPGTASQPFPSRGNKKPATAGASGTEAPGLAAAPEAVRAIPRGSLDEQAVIELKRNPAATYKQLAAALGCRAGTLRDKKKCPMLAQARAILQAQRQAFAEGSTWRDRHPDDGEA